MSVFTLATAEAREEFAKVVVGITIEQCTIERDPMGSDTLDVELLFSGGIRAKFKASSPRQFYIEADYNLPQFVGAGDSPPPSDEIFKLRVV